MNNIECEVRCLISEDEYETLLGQFKDVVTLVTRMIWTIGYMSTIENGKKI